MADKIAKALAKAGMPTGDLYDLPTSPKTFPDGANYRIEISPIETVKVLDATIDEALKQGVPFHRAISTVRGATLLTREELKEFAKIANEAKVEVVITPGPRPSWYTGRQVATPEGAISGFRHRGMDALKHVVMDIQRCIDIGFRAFLVWDEGLLYLLNQMKQNGDLPKDILFKVSIFAGHANPAGFKVIESLGAGTGNPVGDLTLPMLAAIRSVVSIPFDVHITLWASMGGFNRTYESPEIVRVASPCYLKIEQGREISTFLPTVSTEEELARLGRERMRTAKNIIELIKEVNPKLKLSKQGAKDMKIPLPK
ncbi:MAG: hypothetical protein FJ025_00380 [Chloroflexi bacterium]|nr:hypothetical protein [Chloroflexota bacterium]